MAEIKEEKIFEYYLDFPSEVRSVVIDQMSPEDRCRFTRCSSLSQKEAKKCKKFIYGFYFYERSEKEIVFHVLYNRFTGYTKLFNLDSNENICINYTTRGGRELWKTHLDSSTDLMEYACENAKYMIKEHQKTIKRLDLHKTGNYDFEITNLKNLEILRLGYGTENIQQIMSKIGKPLKELNCTPTITKSMAEELEQIYQVQDCIDVRSILINYAQFLRLSASKITMDKSKLSEEDISDFIKLWQNDKIRKNFKSCEWKLLNSKLDRNKLIRLLGINHEGRIGPVKIFEIRQNKDNGKEAMLMIRVFTLIFRVLNQ